MADTYSFWGQVAGRFDEPYLVITNTDYANPNKRMVISGLDTAIPLEGCPDYGTGAGVLAVPAKVTRVSAYTGGTEKSVTAPRGGSSLASQVKLIANPGTLTISSTFGTRGSFRTTSTAMNTATANVLGAHVSGKDQQMLLNTRCKASAFRSIELREGEGIAVSYAEPDYESAGQDFQSDRAVWTVTFSDGTNTFTTTIEVKSILGGNAAVVLFNGAGSGVVLTVVGLEPFYRLAKRTGFIFGSSASFDPLEDFMGDASGTTFNTTTGLGSLYLLVNKVRGDQATGGENLDATPYRSDAPVLTGKVSILGGTLLSKVECDWDRSGIKSSRSINGPSPWPHTVCSNNAFTGIPGRFMMDFAALGSGLVTNRRRMFAVPCSNGARGVTSVFSALKGAIGYPYAGIALAPGEQLIVLPAGNCTFTDLFVSGTITYETVPSAAYPAVGDVDQGVQYGPTGTDYTGTLEQPVVGDVKTGVQYGAGGTEFTGTYGGGGGGNTYSRGRITNA